MVWIFSPPGVSMAAGEERARARHTPPAAAACPSASRSVACQLGIGHCHPLRQFVEHALRHLGRRGLGVGEAEDAPRARVPASSRRSTRMVSTCVLPVPALALTQTDSSRIGRVGLIAVGCAEAGLRWSEHPTWLVMAQTSSRCAGLGGPLGDARQMRVGIVVVGKARAALGLVGRVGVVEVFEQESVRPGDGAGGKRGKVFALDVGAPCPAVRRPRRMIYRSATMGRRGNAVEISSRRAMAASSGSCGAKPESTFVRRRRRARLVVGDDQALRARHRYGRRGPTA